MDGKQISFWIRLRNNVRSRLVRGLLVLVPLGITALILTFIFGATANILAPMLRFLLNWLRDAGAISPDLAKSLQESAMADIASIVVLLVLLYFMGWLASHVVGRRAIGFGESVLLRVPLVKSVYSASKQVVQAVSLPDKAAFKAVVLVEFPKVGAKAVGFLTGHIEISGLEYCKVFIPTSPNPTTGFLQFFPVAEVQMTTMAVEDAFKMIISGGILAPERFVFRAAQALESNETLSQQAGL